MTGHTPGPWEARRTGDRWEIISGAAGFEDGSGVVVGWVETSRPGFSTPRDAADAKLIASAPALLSRLENLFAIGSVALGHLPEDAIGLTALVEELDAARDLIVKARGGT